MKRSKANKYQELTPANNMLEIEALLNESMNRQLATNYTNYQKERYAC